MGSLVKAAWGAQRNAGRGCTCLARLVQLVVVPKFVVLHDAGRQVPHVALDNASEPYHEREVARLVERETAREHGIAQQRGRRRRRGWGTRLHAGLWIYMYVSGIVRGCGGD